MKILADTNIIISSLLYPFSKPAEALYHAADNQYLVITDYNIMEFRAVAKKSSARRNLTSNFSWRSYHMNLLLLR